ncbi:MAG: ArsB/NhaD family transporter [Clostridia bacterium]
MIATIIITVLTIIFMILAILFKPQICIKNIKISTYWIVTLLGAMLLVAFGAIDFGTIFKNLTASTAINPLKILTLFISMSMLSIFLDEVGFFSYIANVVLKKAKTSQTTLFLLLYALVSVLTVFTSNDIIILTFTPFICYFTKNAKINPIPYLVTEFVSANTWSMALIIGNPTNIYLATASNITFINYFTTMIVPTIFGGVTSFSLLYLLFRKQFKKPLAVQDVPNTTTYIEVDVDNNIENANKNENTSINANENVSANENANENAKTNENANENAKTNENKNINTSAHTNTNENENITAINIDTAKIENKPLLIIGLALLAICTILLTISSYIGLEMWLITLICFVALVVLVGITSLIQRKVPTQLIGALKRAPYELIPFVLSMFVVVLALNNSGITNKIFMFFGDKNTAWVYGATSFLTANLINNIPMSVLFSTIISNNTTSTALAVYSAIIGSNLCAIFTPIGALAGIMWSNLIKKHNIKFNFLQFVKYGAIISLPTLCASLLGLSIVL